MRQPNFTPTPPIAAVLADRIYHFLSFLKKPVGKLPSFTTDWAARQSILDESLKQSSDQPNENRQQQGGGEPPKRYCFPGPG